MRIVLIGQAAFGAKALQTLLDRGEHIVAVYAPPDRTGAKPDPLKEEGASRGVPVFQPATYKNDEVFSQYSSLNPDLTILAFVTNIIPARYFDVASKGAICYHPSLLPRHRGASAINWAVIMGDTRTGLSIFRPDGGIDTGPILLQKEIPIGPEDTTGSLYFNQLFPMGIEAIAESVDLIKAGRAPSIVQNEAEATYEPPCDDRSALVDWKMGGREIYNLVRGCDPQPGAFAFSNGEKTRFYGVSLQLEPTGAEPGTIVEIDGRGLHVAVAGGRLVAGKVKSAKGGKVSGSQWAGEKGITSGHRFSSTP